MLDERDTTVNDIIPMITSNLAIQGGDYCLKGTRITVGVNNKIIKLWTSLTTPTGTTS